MMANDLTNLGCSHFDGVCDDALDAGSDSRRRLDEGRAIGPSLSSFRRYLGFDSKNSECVVPVSKPID